MRYPALATLIATLAVGAARADTVILKDGSEREGRVVRQDEKQVVLEVAAGRIKMELILERSEVRDIRKGAAANEKLPAEPRRRRIGPRKGAAAARRQAEERKPKARGKPGREAGEEIGKKEREMLRKLGEIIAGHLEEKRAETTVRPSLSWYSYDHLPYAGPVTWPYYEYYCYPGCGTSYPCGLPQQYYYNYYHYPILTGYYDQTLQGFPCVQITGTDDLGYTAQIRFSNPGIIINTQKVIYIK